MWFSNLEGKAHSYGLRVVKHSTVSVFSVSRPSKWILGASCLAVFSCREGVRERKRSQRGVTKGLSAIKQALKNQLKQGLKSFEHQNKTSGITACLLPKQKCDLYKSANNTQHGPSEPFHGLDFA